MKRIQRSSILYMYRHYMQLECSMKYMPAPQRNQNENVHWSCDFLTIRATFFLKSSRISLHSFAASMFAGDSSLGSDNIEIIDRIIDSTVCTGDHRSAAFSQP
eukprot:TRINITY_DN25088_c0_g2_i4.p5 TRINITY_DN25088_c0_g2~~TRINITY_DN25088_c0_g2_i4.p5  ORF type:complete len:103 (+),score=4.01 TRINITY_DN25088_c0_g2_i4:373-681(+)